MGMQERVFKEIEVVSVRDKVVAALKDAFFARKLKPGDLIVERELARQMNIGTPAIREALVTLQEQGFVKRIANTATYVSKFTVEEVRQLYQLRMELETLALQWAKPRVSEDDLKELDGIIEDMAGAARGKKAIEFYNFDLEFHRTCWKLSGNQFLAQSLDRLVSPLFAFVLNRSEDTVQEATAREHEQLANALRNMQDPEFTDTIRDTLSNFSESGIASFVSQAE